MARRPPVDPRLWRYARSARRYLVLSVGLSVLTTIAIVVAAVMIGRVLAAVITDPGAREIGRWSAELVVLALAVGGRVLATWVQARIAHRAGASVVAELEQSVLKAGAQLPPRELESRRTELAVVVGTGLSGLRGYLVGYLPALLLAALVPPAVWIVIAMHDLTSGIIVVITLPLIPIFMILIGLLTEGRARATLDATTRLSDQLLDLFAGMPTLRALGRESAASEPGAGSTAGVDGSSVAGAGTRPAVRRPRGLGARVVPAGRRAPAQKRRTHRRRMGWTGRRAPWRAGFRNSAMRSVSAPCRPCASPSCPRWCWRCSLRCRSR